MHLSWPIASSNSLLSPYNMPPYLSHIHYKQYAHLFLYNGLAKSSFVANLKNLGYVKTPIGTSAVTIKSNVLSHNMYNV
jgi:hypothetical protein